MSERGSHLDPEREAEDGAAALPVGSWRRAGQGLVGRLRRPGADLDSVPSPGDDRVLRTAERLGALAVVLSLILVGDLLFALFDLTGALLTELFLVLVPSLLWAAGHGRPLGETLRLRRPSAAALVAALLLAPAMCVLSTRLLELQLERMPFTAEELEAWSHVEARVAARPLLAILAFVAAPAIAEEVLFRGAILRAIERRAGSAVAVAVSALLFALLHRSLYRFLPQLVLGVLLGHLAVRSGSLYPPVLLHFAYNLGILLLGHALESGAARGPSAVAAGLFAATGGLLLVRLRPRQERVQALLLVALVAAGSGCGRSGRGASSDAGIAIGIESAPQSYDPRLGLDAASQRLNQLLFASLLEVGPRGELEPDVARSIERTDDCTWTVRLRPDAVFSDGRLLVAEDVRATFTALLPPASTSPRARAFARVEGVEAPDDETVIFHTREPFPSLPVNLTVGIVPAGSPPDVGDRPIGAGPFRLLPSDGLTSLELGRNPLYHRGEVALARMRLRVVPDATTRCLELRKGSLDLVLNAVPHDALAPLAQDPDLRIESAPGTTYWYVGINFQDPVLRRREVRQAIAHAIDRAALIRHLLRGYAEEAAGPLAPGNAYHVDDLPQFRHDPERARELLDQAGYPDPDGPGPGSRLKLILRTSTDETSRLQALAIADQLARVGIDLEVRSYEFSTFFEDVRQGRFQLFTLRLVGLTDPDWFENAFHSRSLPPLGLNRGRYASGEVDGLLERAGREMDASERYRLYAQAQRRIAADVAYVSLYHARTVAVHRSRLEGLELYGSGDFTPLWKVSLAGVATR